MEIALKPFRLVLAQINSTVGDFATNAEKVIGGMQQAKELGADLVAFPELAITGYPPEDLLLKPSFLAANKATLERIASRSGDTTAVVGCVDVIDGGVFNFKVEEDPGALAVRKGRPVAPVRCTEEGRILERTPVHEQIGPAESGSRGVRALDEASHAQSLSHSGEGEEGVCRRRTPKVSDP